MTVSCSFRTAVALLFLWTRAASQETGTAVSATAYIPPKKTPSHKTNSNKIPKDHHSSKPNSLLADLLGSTRSTARVILPEFWIQIESYSDNNKQPAFDCTSYAAEQIRSVTEDCFRDYILTQQMCRKHVTEAHFIGLGNGHCQSNTMISLGGGVISFASSATPKHHDVMECIQQALQSQTCQMAFRAVRSPRNTNTAEPWITGVSYVQVTRAPTRSPITRAPSRRPSVRPVATLQPVTPQPVATLQPVSSSPTVPPIPRPIFNPPSSGVRGTMQPTGGSLGLSPTSPAVLPEDNSQSPARSILTEAPVAAPTTTSLQPSQMPAEGPRSAGSIQDSPNGLDQNGDSSVPLLAGAAAAGALLLALAVFAVRRRRQENDSNKSSAVVLAPTMTAEWGDDPKGPGSPKQRGGGLHVQDYLNPDCCNSSQSSMSTFGNLLAVIRVKRDEDESTSALGKELMVDTRVDTSSVDFGIDDKEVPSSPPPSLSILGLATTAAHQENAAADAVERASDREELLSRTKKVIAATEAVLQESGEVSLLETPANPRKEEGEALETDEALLDLLVSEITTSGPTETAPPLPPRIVRSNRVRSESPVRRSHVVTPEPIHRQSSNRELVPPSSMPMIRGHVDSASVASDEERSKQSSKGTPPRPTTQSPNGSPVRSSLGSCHANCVSPEAAEENPDKTSTGKLDKLFAKTARLKCQTDTHTMTTIDNTTEATTVESSRYPAKQLHKSVAAHQVSPLVVDVVAANKEDYGYISSSSSEGGSSSHRKRPKETIDACVQLSKTLTPTVVKSIPVDAAFPDDGFAQTNTVPDFSTTSVPRRSRSLSPAQRNSPNGAIVKNRRNHSLAGKRTLRAMVPVAPLKESLRALNPFPSPTTESNKNDSSSPHSSDDEAPLLTSVNISHNTINSSILTDDFHVDTSWDPDDTSVASTDHNEDQQFAAIG